MGFTGLNIGKVGLLTHQTALDVTGHNLANSATTGYSRQRTVIVPAQPQVYSYGIAGRGAQVRNIVRLTDSFIEGQLRVSQSSVSDWGVREDVFAQLEAVFNELAEGNGLTDTMNEFWKGVQDVIDNVEDASTRTSFLESAQNLVDHFHLLYQKLYDLRASLDEQVEMAVTDINSLITQVGEYNHTVLRLEFAGTSTQQANDVRDQREVAIKKLSELMNVTVIEREDGTVTLTNHGMPLVEREVVRPVKTAVSIDRNLDVHSIVFQDDDFPLYITSGKLNGLIDARDTIVTKYMDYLDDLSAGMIYNINDVHAKGMGIERYTSIVSDSAVVDPALAFNDPNFKLNFTPRPGTFEPVNGSFVVRVRNKITGEIVDNHIAVDLDGVAVPADTSLNSLAADINAIANISASVNPQNHLVINAGTDYEISFADDTSGILATLGIGNLFTGYDADSIGLNQNVVKNPMLLAAAKSDAVGDNTNFFDLFNLRSDSTMSNKTVSFDEFYGSAISTLGVESNEASTNVVLSEQIHLTLTNKREDVSGVSQDEEVISMIASQRAYQGMARFISIVDSTLDTLINRM